MNTLWAGGAAYVDAAGAVAAVAAAAGANKIPKENGAGGLTGVAETDIYADADAVAALAGTSALTISGSDDSLTASTSFGSAAVWTASPTGNITITTDLIDGQAGELALTPASGKTVTLSQSGMTFTVVNDGTAVGDISGDGSTVYVIVMNRVGSVIEYSVATR